MSCDLISLALPGVRQIKPYKPGKPLEQLEREYGITDSIKLASNENPLGAGESAKRAVRACLENLGRYPDGNGFHLKRALSASLGVGADQLTLGNGSNELLELVARAYVKPEHEVVYSEHAFVVYPLVTLAIGARAVVTPARAFGHDLEAMRAAISPDTRLIFIANPNNPTGTWLDRDALHRFLETTPEDCLVLVDEAYCEYVEEPDYPDCVAWIAEFPNLIVTRTFSKIHGLAALRVGYGVSHPDVSNVLNRVRQPFNVNSPAMAAAAAALGDEAHVSESVALNRRGMGEFTRACDRLGLGYIPSVGNFLSIRIGPRAADVYEALLREGVIVRPIAEYGLDEHLRVTIGTDAENARFLSALERVLEPA